MLPEWNEWQNATARARASVSAVDGVKQPALAMVRRHALDDISAAAQAFAAFERAAMSSGVEEVRLMGLHGSFYEWAIASIGLVSS